MIGKVRRFGGDDSDGDDEGDVDDDHDDGGVYRVKFLWALD